jgi:hypothetical protein
VACERQAALARLREFLRSHETILLMAFVLGTLFAFVFMLFFGVWMLAGE